MIGGSCPKRGQWKVLQAREAVPRRKSPRPVQDCEGVYLSAVGLLDGSCAAQAYGTVWNTVESPSFKEPHNPQYWNFVL